MSDSLDRFHCIVTIACLCMCGVYVCACMVCMFVCARVIMFVCVCVDIVTL